MPEPLTSDVQPRDEMPSDGAAVAQASSTPAVENGDIRVNGSANEEALAPTNSHRLIQAGDLVILFVNRNAAPIPITVTPGEELSNFFGTFAHDSMVGLPFGSRMYSKNKRGFMHLLRPTPSLWTLALPHRTQILYLPDISFIIAKLGLSPGARVIEAGTGSGSMTHALARTVATAGQCERRWRGVEGMGSGASARGARGRSNRDMDSPSGSSTPGPEGKAPADKQEDDGDALAVAPSQDLTLEEAGGELQPGEGRVWSFEFHSERAKKARIEFSAHGLLSSTVALNHRNVCKSGFGLPQGMAADAVFLDLPAPWDAIPFAKQALRTDVTTTVCTFSPCIEQVLRTVQAFNEHGFVDVQTYESLTREHEVHTGSIAPLKSVGEVVRRIKEIEVTRERKRQEQIRVSKLRKEREAAKASSDEASGDVGTAAGEKRPLASDDEDANEAPDAKRQRQKGEDGVAGDSLDEDAQMQAASSAGAHESRPVPRLNGHSKADGTDSNSLALDDEPALVPGGSKISIGSVPLQASNVLSKPMSEMRGHTSYLTFATLKPIVQSQPARPAAAQVHVA